MESLALEADAPAAPKNTRLAVIVKFFEQLDTLKSHKPCLTTLETYRSDISLMNRALGPERYVLSGPQCGFQTHEGALRKVNPSAYFLLGLTYCREGIF